MDIKDATLMMMSESADHPAVASLAGSAYERLVNEEPVDYRLLNDLIGEASGKGLLRALNAKVRPCRVRRDHRADPRGDRAAGADQVPRLLAPGRPGGRPAAREHLATALGPRQAR